MCMRICLFCVSRRHWLQALLINSNKEIYIQYLCIFSSSCRSHSFDFCRVCTLISVFELFPYICPTVLSKKNAECMGLNHLFQYTCLAKSHPYTRMVIFVVPQIAGNIIHHHKVFISRHSREDYRISLTSNKSL